MGSLFMKNYRRKIVTASRYLKQLIRYIHNNPVAAGLAKRSVDYEFGTLNCIMQKTFVGVHNYELVKLFGSIEEMLRFHSLEIDDASIGIDLDFWR